LKLSVVQLVQLVYFKFHFYYISQLTGVVWQELNNAELLWLGLTRDIVLDESIMQDGIYMVIA